MEYFKQEFAAKVGCSVRTLVSWAQSKNGNPPALSPAGYKTIGKRKRPFYTDSQLEEARRLLERGKQIAAGGANKKSRADDAPEITFDDTNTDGTTETEKEKAAIVDATITLPVSGTVDAEIVTLDQRAEKIRRLQADVQRGIIEIGLELIAAKAEVGHGNWNKWLETEFDWTDRTARYFMAVAERFGNRNMYSVLKPSTLKAMLALPVGDEQDFIDAQAEAGRPITEQSARDVQKHVKEWNAQRNPQPPTVDEHKPAAVPEQQETTSEVTDTPQTIENVSEQIYAESFSPPKTGEDVTVPKAESSTVTEENNAVAAQIDDAEKLIVGNKPLDSCCSVVVIDDDDSFVSTSDDDLITARAFAQIALNEVAAALQTADSDALKAATRALNAIRDELYAKKIVRDTTADGKEINNE